MLKVSVRNVQQSRQNKEPVIHLEEVKVDLAARLLMLVHSNAISADVHRVHSEWSGVQGACFMVGTIFSWEAFKKSIPNLRAEVETLGIC